MWPRARQPAPPRTVLPHPSLALASHPTLAAAQATLVKVAQATQAAHHTPVKAAHPILARALHPSLAHHLTLVKAVAGTATSRRRAARPRCLANTTVPRRTPLKPAVARTSRLLKVDITLATLALRLVLLACLVCLGQASRVRVVPHRFLVDLAGFPMRSRTMGTTDTITMGPLVIE